MCEVVWDPWFELHGLYSISFICVYLQSFMVMDRSTLYGSRSMFDQHRDMRLDVDNMTYEVTYQ